ncbi:putative zinc-binding protein [Dehalobacterium formicoaceticum]|uniref:Glycine cleavage system H protein n=1 Tax=Dehalobacterium formicoaceticum TaxID=51515 RepID=A0ABT1Y1E3_9FIRM|nr:putative zinc-binding protein [Dehalobacterium formicoaceticum]MCR6544678.1 glycine cleavage system protein H [Dehalobacterium formicoaceticum]
MTKKYTVLPCSGMDKTAGSMTREIALRLAEETKSEVICPVFYRVSDARYNKLAQENPLLVIDGCGTRCASKLAAEKGLKITEKINITEEVKKNLVEIGSSLRLGEKELHLCALILHDLLQEEAKTGEEEKTAGKEAQAAGAVPENIQYEKYSKDKFIFRIPKEGFYFIENDCWAYVVGNKARIGVTDFVQKSLSDIMFFTPPAVGREIEQFEEAGSIESGKAVFEIICPVSGVITAVNQELLDYPEYINDNPYEKGWIAELELTDFESDKELLVGFDAYFEILKRKVDEFHV